MQFEWDEAKNNANIAKHGISFGLAQLVFYSTTVHVVDDRSTDGETRIISLGVLEGVVVLAVVHTDREGRIRLISARKASRRERAIYHDTIQEASKR